MTQKQIDSRLRDLQPFLARAKASGDTAVEARVLKEIYFLEDMWMDLEMEKSPSRADEQFEADMLDLGGCSDPYAGPSPFGRTGSGW